MTDDVHPLQLGEEGDIDGEVVLLVNELIDKALVCSHAAVEEVSLSFVLIDDLLLFPSLAYVELVLHWDRSGARFRTDLDRPWWRETISLCSS